MQNQQNKQRHFHSASKTACRLSKSIIGQIEHSHGWHVLSKSKNSFWIVCTVGRSQCSASDAVIQRFTPQKYCSIFKNEVHLAANLKAA